MYYYSSILARSYIFTHAHRYTCVGLGIVIPRTKSRNTSVESVLRPTYSEVSRSRDCVRISSMGLVTSGLPSRTSEAVPTPTNLSETQNQGYR